MASEATTTGSKEGGEDGGSVVGSKEGGGKGESEGRRRRTDEEEEWEEEEEEDVWTQPWLERVGPTPGTSKEQRIHAELVAFCAYLAPTPDERHTRALVIAQVAAVARRRFPRANVDTFGSVAQDLYLPDADTDMVVTTPGPLDDSARKRGLFHLASHMRDAHVTPHVQVIHRARVPVISFQTVPELGSLKIDISLNATDGIRAVPILRDFFTRMPALRFLILALKSLLSRHGLNNASSSGLSSYGLICLAVSFLQRNPRERPREHVDAPMEHAALGGLLLDFLYHYGHEFDYATSVVSVRTGRLLTKEEKGWANASNPLSLSIECIMNPDNDVGRPTSKIGRIRALFRKAYARLQEYALEGDSAMHNVLGTVLGVSNTTLEHRALFKDIVVSGSLSRALRDVEQTAQQVRRPPYVQSQRRDAPRYGPANGSGYQGGGERHRASGSGSSGLPPKPPPHTQATAPASKETSIATPGRHAGLPPRPGGGRYVAQGPSFGAMRVAAQGPGNAQAPGQGQREHDMHSSPSSKSDAGQPPRRKRKA